MTRVVAKHVAKMALLATWIEVVHTEAKMRRVRVRVGPPDPAARRTGAGAVARARLRLAARRCHICNCSV